MTVAQIQPRHDLNGSYDNPVSDWVRLLTPAAELARVVAETEFVPRGMRGKPAAVTAVILAAHELGIGPMTGLRTVDVVEGKVALSAELIRGLVLKAGHDIWVEESSGEQVTIAGKRANSDHVTHVTWSMADARRARLDGKNNWRAYPRQMLQARATAELGRLIFADVLAGLAATEELDDDGTTPAVTGPAPATARRTAKRRTAVAANPAEPIPAPEQPPGEPDDLPLPDESPTEPKPPETISEPQTKMMHALLRTLGVNDRAERLALASRIVTRDVTSSKELTRDEASLLIDTLIRAEHDDQIRHDLGIAAPDPESPDDNPSSDP